MSRCTAMGKRYVLGFAKPRPGRPNIEADKAVAALRRFRELRAAGMGITEAEERMLEEDEWKRMTSRQGVRKLCEKGEAVEADFAFKEFCVAAIGPFGWFMRRDYFSYKTDRK